jgi:fatty acid desaturase
MEAVFVNHPHPVSDDHRTKIIRKEVQQSYKDIRAKYPFLRHQNAIGFGIFAVSIAMIVLGAVLYLQQAVSFIILLPWIAFWTSLLHELEHDLIHYMYFKKNKFMQNLMMFGVWIFRPMTINPWLRREIHFHHHRVSGSKTDIEERGITNGEKWGVKRFLTVADVLLGGVLRGAVIRRDVIDAVKSGEVSKEQAFEFKKVKLYGMLPFTLFLYFIWYFFLIHYTISFTSNIFHLGYQSPAFIAAQFKWVNPLVAILIAPNLFRMFSLHFISSNMHYFGDVETGNIMQQTQVLNKWYFLPMQLFCFNFGGTHAIHHFVVNETFYIRQLTASRAHTVMRAQGVRFNDVQSMARANRFREAPELAI